MTDVEDKPKTVNELYKRHILQRNQHAGKHPEDYRIELQQNDKIIRDLQPGDVIDLLACKQYSGWQNYVYAAGIEIWSYDDLTEAEAVPPDASA